MAKRKNRHRKGKGNANQSRYTPLLSRPEVMAKQAAWEGNQPRLTDKQFEQLGHILRTADTRRVELTGNRFAWVRYHEQLEKEVADKVYTDKILGGIKAGIEWKLWFFKSVHRAMLRDQQLADPYGKEPPYQPFLDGMLPTPEFLATPLFDGIEQFQPRIVLYQFEEQGKYLESAEEAIHNSERRRDQGDAYFNTPQRLVSHMPKEGGDEDVTKPVTAPVGPEGIA